MSDPLYDVVVVLHVLFAVVGFGALAATGAYARAVQRAADPFSHPALRSFFRPGHNVAARALYLVPVAGGMLLALGHGADARAAWPWIGLGLWIVAAGLATSVMWPAESKLQRLISEGADPGGLVRPLAARLEAGGAACTLVFVLALGVMIAQP